MDSSVRQHNQNGKVCTMLMRQQNMALTEFQLHSQAWNDVVPVSAKTKH